ncbi:carboxymuconolactone decarboxylase family protein [Arhodomonas sp. SL1]|uniref:carboxymuconolactone decarboxylase family protein n=1 Tax=Arhodomonas sp. SL1 TaxID=3425691 RepID=UPI003F88555B
MSAETTPPEEALELLREVAQTFEDTIPNVYRQLARSPLALEAFVHLERSIGQRGQLTRAEQALVALQVSVHNGCEYCSGVFRHEAADAGVEDGVIAAVVGELAVGEARYAALIDATRRILERKGRLGRAELTLLEERGVSFESLLEIVTIIAAFTLPTYTNNLFHTRVDPEFR